MRVVVFHDLFIANDIQFRKPCSELLFFKVMLNEGGGFAHGLVAVLARSTRVMDGEHFNVGKSARFEGGDVGGCNLLAVLFLQVVEEC